MFSLRSAFARAMTAATLRYLIAAIAGLSLTLSLAPLHYWPLGIVSTALLAGCLKPATPAQAALTGWFYGLGLFGSGSSWVYVSIHIYGYAPVPLAAALTALFSAALALLSSLTCYLYVRWLRDKTIAVAGFAAIFVLGEWLRTWLLTGFPWLYLGYAHINTPLAGLAPIGGVLAISFVVAYSGAYIAHGADAWLLRSKPLAFGQPGFRLWRFQPCHFWPWLNPHLVILSLLWLGSWSMASYDWSAPSEKGTAKIAIVQANISQKIKWNPDQYWPTLNLYNTLSEPLWPQVDMVIWPEAAIPGYYQNARYFLKRMENKALAHHSSLITGLPYRESNRDSSATPRIYNSIMAFGNGNGTYHKQRLVPFGEYVPLEKLLRGLITFFDLPMSSFSPGPANQSGINAAGISLAPFICYEIVYPDLVASWLPQADVLITISNDAWFGRSIGPLQHLQMAQMRALENARYLIRATGNGVSAIVNQYGQITRRSEQFQRQILTGTVTALTGTTPFARFGSWPVIIVCLLICSAAMLNHPLRDRD